MNQLLIDGPLKGLSELRLLKECDTVVPNSFISLNNLLSSTTDGLKAKATSDEEDRLKSLIRENQRDNMYQILPKKARDRDTVMKKF